MHLESYRIGNHCLPLYSFFGMLIACITLVQANLKLSCIFPFLIWDGSTFIYSRLIHIQKDLHIGASPI